MITVVCPLYNEEAYIKPVLDFYLAAAPADKELLLIDGGSNDRTVAIIKEYQQKDASIHLIHNPDKFVPFALNKAISVSKGDPVIRLDAHTVYAPDYFTSVLEAFRKSGADIVGGPMRAVGKEVFQNAVAIATSTSFGVGDSGFHDERNEGFTESVYLGAWKRSVFEATGLFDTDMLRNQDDEFHYRARANGMRIYLDPAIKSWYAPRSTMKSLWRQYYQYGLFKPLVLRKVSSGIRLRHLIPAGFVCYLMLSLFSYWYPVLLIPAILYLFLDLFYCFKHGSSFAVSLKMLLVYPILHFSYGLGFIYGFILLLTGKKPAL